MAAQATAVVGVALQLDAPSLNEPLLAFLATRAGITALCAAIVSRQQRASREGYFDVLWSDGESTTMTAQAIAANLC